MALNLIFKFPKSKHLNANCKNIFKIIIICSVIPFLMPTAFAKDITFSELGLATEISSGQSFRTPNATFYSNSTEYPLEVSVNSSFGFPYYLTIYLNDKQVESHKIIEGIQGGTVTFSVTFNNIKKGNNTLFISGYTILESRFGMPRMKGETLYPNNLIIYGDSKISSPDIFLPPRTLTSTQTSTGALPLEMLVFFLVIGIIIAYTIGNPKKEQTYEPNVPYEINGNIPDQEYSTYTEYLNSDEWKNRTDSFKLKANGKCYLCDKFVGTKNLVSHHKQYPKNYKDDKEDNLIAICWTCHKKIHGTENT